MTEIWAGVVLLSVISVCAVATTITLLITTKDLRRILQRVNPMLPTCQLALQEARRTLREAQELLTRTNHATREVETLIHKTCETVSGAIDHVASLRGRAEALLSKRFGNGARLGPRRRNRG